MLQTQIMAIIMPPIIMGGNESGSSAGSTSGEQGAEPKYAHYQVDEQEKEAGRREDQTSEAS